MADFLKIAITLPQVIDREAERIMVLLDSGDFGRVHLRHPAASDEEMSQILRDLRPAYYSRLSIHGHEGMAKEFPGVGIHMKSHSPASDSIYSGVLSKSCHSLKEVEESFKVANYDYVFLSPIFDSISKLNYQSAFPSLEILTPYLLKYPIVALGGVTQERLPILENLGFKGAAMLGGVEWPI